MYKRFTVPQLTQISNKFLANLEGIFRKERVATLKDLLKLMFKQGESVIYRQGSEPLFSFARDGDVLTLTDEKDRIELVLSPEDVIALNALCKKDTSKSTKNNKSVREILTQAYQDGQYRTILDKPYIVYDIETLYATNDLTTLVFELGYSICSLDEHEDFHRNFKYI